MVSEVAERALAGVRAGVDAALGLEGWRLPASDVAELVAALAREESRLAAARLAVLAEASERRAGAGSGFVSTAGWYAAVTNTRKREATATTSLATALGGSLGPTGSRWRRG